MPAPCPECGTANPWPDAFCRQCGRFLDPEQPAKTVIAVRLGPDSSSAAAVTADGMLNTWTQAAGTSARPLPIDGGQVIAAAIAGDLEGVVYATGDDTLRIIHRGGAGRTVGPLPASVRALDVSTDGALAVVACSDGSVHWLQVYTGRFEPSVVIASPINAIAIADHGVSFASCIDGGLRRIDMWTGAVTAIWYAPGITSSVAVTPDGSSAVIGHDDGRVVCWDLNATAISIVVNVGTEVRALAIASGADCVLIATKDGTIRLQSLITGTVLTFYTGLLGPTPGARPIPTTPMRSIPAAPRIPTPAESGVPASATPAPVSPVVDDDVQFTVYRPSVLSAGQWQILLVFVHKSGPVADPDYGLIRPLEEVKARARAQFGDVETNAHSVDAQQALLRGNALHIVPDLPGLTCDPATVTVLWRGPVHEARFLIRASPGLAGSVVRGWIRIWCGPLILGEVSVRLHVAPVSGAPPGFEDDYLTGQRLSRYRKIFPSYSRRDRAVVEQVAVAARALGDQYLQDVLTLRSGEPWSTRLLELIEEADVFQLFWSSNSMRSPHCRTEWEHALALRRLMFVRPLYWEDPFPEAPDLGMPPDQLRELHFAHVPVTAPSAITDGRQRPTVQAPAPRDQPSQRRAPQRPLPQRPSEEHSQDRHQPEAQMTPRIPRPPQLSPPAARKRSRTAFVFVAAVLILALALCAALVVFRGGP